MHLSTYRSDAFAMYRCSSDNQAHSSNTYVYVLSCNYQRAC